MTNIKAQLGLSDETTFFIKPFSQPVDGPEVVQFDDGPKFRAVEVMTDKGVKVIVEES